MNQYRRIVSYLYQYLNGEKGQNIGYARIEQKGRQCRVTIQMRPVETSFMPEVWLFKQETAAIEYISIGRLAAHSGSLQLKIVTSTEDVCSSGHPASDFDGAVIYISDKEYYATTWTNESIYIGNKINMLDRTVYNGNNEGLKNTGLNNTDKEKVEDNRTVNNISGTLAEDDGIKNNNVTDNKTVTDSEDTGNKLTENTASGTGKTDNTVKVTDGGNNTKEDNGSSSVKETGKNISSQDVHEPDIKTQDIEEGKLAYGCSACPYKSYNKKNEDFGVRILRSFPVMYPFRSGDIEESVRIEPKDIGCMPIRLWSFANNRFLLHGYYCYKHLIFAKLCSGSYALGVPGVYSDQESKRAAAFSFTGFQPVGPVKTMNGVFGYWITEINT